MGVAGAGEGGCGGTGPTVVPHPARVSNSAASSVRGRTRGPGRPAAHNPPRTDGCEVIGLMWVIYLNIVIAVVIVAVFVIWTFRGRK